MKSFSKYLKVNAKLFISNVIKLIKKKVGTKTFILLASLIIGVASGLASVILKNLVHYFQTEPGILLNYLGLPYLKEFLPLIGILISVLIISVIYKDKFTRGLSNLIYIILRKDSNVPRRKIFSHMITSGVTVGLGGSAGLEAPIVLIGSSIGSNIANHLKLNYQARTLLLACGAAGGISAIFNSPIAGVIFAVEVLLPEITISAFIPLLLASASAAVLSKFMYSGQLFYLVTEGWHLYAIPYYIVLGVLCGIISLYIIRVNFFLEHLLGKIPFKYLKAFAGGIILCILIYFFPSLYGEGYTSIVELLDNSVVTISYSIPYTLFEDKELSLLFVLLLIILLKAIATAITLGSGGNGGIIAPSLFTGAITGYFLARLTDYFGIVQLNNVNFLVVGMAGILSGVLHAPLTGIFLIAEITGGYTLIVPLMIVTALSFFISKYFHPNSVYTMPLDKMGIKFRSEKEKYFAQHANVTQLTEKGFETLNPQLTLGELMNKIQLSKRNIFPVIDKDGILLGIVSLDDVREIMLNREVYDVILIYEIMNTNFKSVEVDADINSVIEIFEKEKVWNLAVTEKGRYVGFISKSNLFNKYINAWADEHKDDL